MKLSKTYTTVTPLSKTLALILFIALPFIGFYLGTSYQANMNKYNTPTLVVRTPQVTPAPIHCGGNIKNPPTCPANLHCAPDPASKLPFGDVGGICIK